MGKAVFYLGKRMAKGSLRHAVTTNPNRPDEFTYYPKAKDNAFWGAVVGREYQMPEEGFPAPWSEAETGKTASNALVLQALVRSDLEMHKAKNAEKDPEFAKIVRQIRELTERMSTARRAALVSFIIREIMK